MRLDADIKLLYRGGKWCPGEISMAIEVRDVFSRDAMSADYINYTESGLRIEAAHFVLTFNAPDIE